MVPSVRMVHRNTKMWWEKKYLIGTSNSEAEIPPISPGMNTNTILFDKYLFLLILLTISKIKKYSLYNETETRSINTHYIWSDLSCTFRY